MGRSQDRFGLNEGYLAELYDQYRKDPLSVDVALRGFFEEAAEPSTSTPLAAPDVHPLLRTRTLVHAIREQGHRAAHLDPLGLRRPDQRPVQPETHGLTQGGLAALPPGTVESPLAQGAGDAAEAIDRLRSLYCGTTGYEFAHVSDHAQRAWLYHSVESNAYAASLDRQPQRHILQRLTQAAAFEEFLHRAFPGQRWFSLEGLDALVLLLDEILWHACYSELRTVIMGMGHRGRLNILAHLCEKPYEQILAEFLGGSYEEDNAAEDIDQGWMRDVKYHEGAEAMYPVPSGGEVALRLLPNPSHVELVDPVVIGAVRAVQDAAVSGDRAPGATAMGLLIHGDAAFAGEGIVAETLNLAKLAGYGTGGTIHVIANNQVGFTTEPREAASTSYVSGLARGFDVPVVHVNADDVAAVISAARLAMAYRQRFHCDFLIDLVGYRRYGHNEADEPAFTQPVMYEAVRRHPTVRDLWARELVGTGVVTQEEADRMKEEALGVLQEAMVRVKEHQESAETPEEPAPARTEEEPYLPGTAVPLGRLAQYNHALHQLPEGFALHPRLEQTFRRRQEGFEQDGRVDWAFAEALAFASLLADGVSVRLAGQDTERGTFSQRHAVLHDVNTGKRHVPLAALAQASAVFQVYNSPLTEAAALGFEFGYTLEQPFGLVLWEAQFGDFVNNAQGIVDEFIVSAHAKWGQRSGLVLLLPHGHEGQGPNHSSGHLERFLQLAAEGNLGVAYPTTAAQYFHLLRAHADRLHREDPVPLVVMTPKSLLRHTAAASSAGELAEGAFAPVLDDPESPEEARRVALCAGKVFADLVAHRSQHGGNGTAVVRLEQLASFPKQRLREALKKYEGAEVCWVQEEPRNRGAWTYVAPRLRDLLGQDVRYIGRPERASPAEGLSAMHKAEQARIVQEAFSGTRSPVRPRR